MASAQLQLIDTERPWKLDRRTVEIGRAGLAQARAALAASTAVASADVAPFEALTAAERPGHNERRAQHRAAA